MWERVPLLFIFQQRCRYHSRFCMRKDDYKFIWETVYRHRDKNHGADKTEPVSARLVKRVRTTGLVSKTEYGNFLRGPDAAGEIEYPSAVISNKRSYCFLEQSYFAVMRHIILPDLLRRRKESNWSRWRIWSAAPPCGEKPCSLAIDPAIIFPAQSIHLRGEIGATYIFPWTLRKEVAGVYPSEAMRQIPPRALVRHYPQMVYRDLDAFPLFKSSIRHPIKFLGQPPPGEEQFHVIFCRYLMILFDWATKSRLLTYLKDHLVPRAISFIGHSESPAGVNHGPTVRPAIHLA